MNMEQRYWELREKCERAFDKYCGERTDENLRAYRKVFSLYQDFCMDVLEMLMDENSDVLARLEG